MTDVIAVTVAAAVTGEAISVCLSCAAADAVVRYRNYNRQWRMIWLAEVEIELFMCMGNFSWIFMVWHTFSSICFFFVSCVICFICRLLFIQLFKQTLLHLLHHKTILCNLTLFTFCFSFYLFWIMFRQWRLFFSAYFYCFVFCV